MRRPSEDPEPVRAPRLEARGGPAGRGDAVGGVSWAPRRTADGSWTLVSTAHGEACHSRSGAWREARERYARPCRLRELARRRPLVRVLDIGTGLGLNLAAALGALEGTDARLELVSLERDPDVVRTTLRLFDGRRVTAGAGERHHAVVRAALRDALAGDEGEAAVALAVPAAGASLRLLLGDARRRLTELDPERPFDAVFLDPFSPRREPALWRPGFLVAVARRLGAAGWLSTYAASFHVRLALARTGLAVGLGPRVADKAEGTLARRPGAVPAPPPLWPKVARRLQRALASPESAVEGGFLGIPLGNRAGGID